MEYREVSIEMPDELYEELCSFANEVCMTPEDAFHYILIEKIDGIREMCRTGNEIAIKEGYLQR